MLKALNPNFLSIMCDTLYVSQSFRLILIPRGPMTLRSTQGSVSSIESYACAQHNDTPSGCERFSLESRAETIRDFALAI